KNDPANYNQALMDFGATICKPALPLCDACPLQKECVAYEKNLINVLPVKEKSVSTRERFFNYLVVTTGDKTYVRQRMDKDIWQNLYEFILIETESQLPEKEIINSSTFTSFFKENNYDVIKISKLFKQKLTHQIIKGRFIHVKIKPPGKALKNYEAVSAKELALLAFPKFISSYLAD
ncbi:MAG: NUDIX domain-containing protein, partial [Bacteroidota bacterium]|nr:NUDIX domain-containing protein [Bacteroidota bacterium]